MLVAVQTPPRPDTGPDPAVLTPGRRAARASTTQQQVARRPSLRERLVGTRIADTTTPLRPFGAVATVRLVLSTLLSVMCLLTGGGALLMLMAWRQERTSGLLSTQTDRLWDVWQYLADVERYVAFAMVPLGVAWTVLAAINVRRATGRKRSPIFAAAMMLAGIAGAWAVGDQIVAEADDWVATASGIALQAVFVALPLLALERLADAAEARHRPLRVTFLMAVGYLVALQTSGALSTIDRSTELDGWGRTGAYLLIAALLQSLGTLAASEAGRALEEGTNHRYELRHRFGESVLAQAGL
jgi:hypothetical protein